VGGPPGFHLFRIAKEVTAQAATPQGGLRGCGRWLIVGAGVYFLPAAGGAAGARGDRLAPLGEGTALVDLRRCQFILSVDRLAGGSECSLRVTRLAPLPKRDTAVVVRQRTDGLPIARPVPLPEGLVHVEASLGGSRFHDGGLALDSAAGFPVARPFPLPEVGPEVVGRFAATAGAEEGGLQGAAPSPLLGGGAGGAFGG
jgi:hypothetical protein